MRGAKTCSSAAAGAENGRDALTRLRISSDTVVSYLRERGTLADGTVPAVNELSGGISNEVLSVISPPLALVVKQSLEKLRVVGDWEFDPRRILIEAECMRTLGCLLGGAGVPKVVDVDEANLAFTMTLAPAGGVVWKDALLAGQVDLSAARRSGAVLGRIHRLAADHDALATRFGDLMPLLQGRIDPYHRTAAAANPDLAEAIQRDIDRLTSQRRTLVLGDYSPKNIVVYPDSILILDFEVAHWGDPSFDTGFLLTHLIAKAIRAPHHAQELICAARAFWDAYRDEAGAAGASEQDTARELAVLLLCRVDGKSQLEYLDHDARAVLRACARSLIRSEEDSLHAIFTSILETSSGSGLT